MCGKDEEMEEGTTEVGETGVVRETGEVAETIMEKSKRIESEGASTLDGVSEKHGDGFAV